MLRSLPRHAGTTLSAVAVATVVSLAPSATAAETSGSTASAVFDSMSCSGSTHTVDVAVKNPSPSSATFTIRVDGPNTATPNTVRVGAQGSNTVKVTLPNDATKATVEDSAGSVIGTGNLTCSSSSSSSSGSGAAKSSAAAQPSPALPSDATAPVEHSTTGGDGTRKIIGFGVAGLGVLLAAALFYREFRS